MQTPRPVVGVFRSAEDNAPRTEKPAETVTPPVVEEKPADVAVAVEAVQKELEADAKLTPAERYQKRLGLAKIDIDEARGIFDAVLSKGYYEEYVRLGKSGRRAVLRTRTYEDALRLQTELETVRPYLSVTSDELVTRFNLAASLYEWDGKPLAHESEADFEAIIKILMKMPGPIYNLLSRELAKFDHKTMMVFEDGAVENFS